MAADEWRSATVEQLCSAAGLNKRYFYEGFADLDELASAVVDDIADEVRRATLAASPPPRTGHWRSRRGPAWRRWSGRWCAIRAGPGYCSAGSRPPRACADIASG